MKKLLIIPVAAFSLFIVSCSEEKKLIRKASNAVDVYDYDKALTYYDQVLAKDSNSYYANAGKGIVLAEYINKYDKAIPYLERAIKKSPSKTTLKINNDLGKSYHYIGNYPRALYFYEKTTPYNKVENPDYDLFLYKRMADCKYAIEHPEVAPPEQQSVKNVGSTINTEMPEYGPVYTHGELIFTSKRKDSPKEKKNGIDRRYFESMYISSLSNGEFSPVRRFTRPDYAEDSDFKSGGESVVSASPDGKTLYIFRGSKLYEATLNDSTKNEHLMPGNINFSYLQSHAFVSPDGKMLFFTSMSEKGLGGMDIYTSQKGEDGKWMDPKILPSTINSGYNEDAPFLTEDGTLFFSSNGLPGYGGYDVYKTRMVNGEWIAPENLGQPINTPGDDMYFALNPNSSKGFYSSNRPGGKGDMDIYYVHYVSTEVPECKSMDTLFAISADPNPENSMSYNFSVQIPEQYKKNIKSVSLKVNDEPMALSAANSAQYTFTTANVYKVSAKAVVYCDTCPALLAMCSEKEITVGQTLFVNADSTAANTSSLASTPAKPEAKTNIQKDKPLNNNFTPGTKEELSLERLKALGWNSTPAYFDYDKSVLNEDARKLLDQNIIILKKNTDLIVVVNGYADSRGTDAYNKALSARRANSVKGYLVQNGIAKSRINAVNAYGEGKIENGCTDDAACDEDQHLLNRKVDFNVLTNIKMITVAIQN